MPRSTVTLLVVALLAGTLAVPAAGAASAAGPADGAAAASAALACGGAPAEPTARAAGAAVRDAETNVSVDTLVAPGFAYDRLRNASAIHATAADGLLVPATMDTGESARPRDVVAKDDVAVHHVRLGGNASALLDHLAAQGGKSPSADFRALVATGGIDFEYRWPGACTPHLAVNATFDRGAFRVVPDERNDTLYLVVNVDEVVYERGDRRSSDGWEPSAHEMELALAPASGLVSTAVVVEDRYGVGPTRATFSESGGNPYLTLAADPGREVGGQTTAAVGETLTVELALENGSTMTRTVRVHGHPEEGIAVRHYHATYDLSDVAEGTGFAVTVRRGDAVVGETTGEVNTSTASVSLPASERLDDGRVVLDSVTLSHGGFVRVTAGVDATVGTTGYLAPGTHEDVAVSLDPDHVDRISPDERSAVAVRVHRDSNGNRLFDRWTDGVDPAYVVDGAVVRAEAPIGPPTPTPSATPSPTVAETPDRATVTTPDAPTASPTPTAIRSPGFGPLLALVAVALVALRPRRGRGAYSASS